MSTIAWRSIPRQALTRHACARTVADGDSLSGDLPPPHTAAEGQRYDTDSTPGTATVARDCLRVLFDDRRKRKRHRVLVFDYTPEDY
jgi:hypothetical protein